MKAKKFDADFDSGKNITDALDLSKARRPLQVQKRVNVDFPTWMIESLDKDQALGRDALGLANEPRALQGLVLLNHGAYRHQQRGLTADVRAVQRGRSVRKAGRAG